MYPVCPSSSQEKRATPNIRRDNSIFMHGFPYVHLFAKFPNWPTGAQVNFFPFLLQVCSNRRRYFYFWCVSSSRDGHGHSSEVALLLSRSRLLFLRRHSTGSSRISTPGPTMWAREARFFGQTCIGRGLIHDT